MPRTRIKVQNLASKLGYNLASHAFMGSKVRTLIGVLTLHHN